MKLETCGRASCTQIQAAMQVAFDNQLALLKSLLNRTVGERDREKAAAKHWNDMYREAAKCCHELQAFDGACAVLGGE